MGSDDEIEEDEEEILVYVEFEGFVDGKAFSNENLQLDMIGLDTDHPVMQINGRFYEGTYEDAVGTYMFFTKNDKPVVDDPVFDTPATLKYVTKTRKLLKMQRVFIKQRTEVLGDSEDPRCVPNLDTLKDAGVPLKYQEEGLAFWKSLRNNRMNALQLYLEKQRIRVEKKSQGIELESESDEDSPFAAYKHRAEIINASKVEVYNDNLENDETRLTPPTKISTKTGDATENVNPECIELKNGDPGPSTSKDTNSHSIKKGQQIVVARKKKIHIIHDPRKKKCKKKIVAVKSKNVPADNKVEELPILEEESEETDKPSEMETTEPEETEEDEMTNNTEVTPAQGLPDSKVAKQLKREAKMKEISERLKLIVGEYTNTKAD